ncbi:hypothetical protein CCR75_002227 [Bremia lactucae]|uniref:Transmembrane protein 230 n=1 Tax=Bremia lactucae TaxID=4779 RepID=A0A976IFQ2_BRELC|nr:hypothetical protein CCR75_002227 [Bremia lactucae]
MKIGAYRRKSFPIRTGVAAASLFVIGTFLLYVSTLIGLDEEKRGISFLVLGLIGMIAQNWWVKIVIAFIPGSYATYQLYGAWKGWKGYDYDQIPSYDD